MGAFHDGHLSLMRTAKQECDKVVVSLFVNPLQFGANEDLAKYPRDEERDAAMAREAGADVLFVPTVEEIYPRDSTVLHVPEVTTRWEGAIRPGHFDGVATVVCKLFNMVCPTVAYFGLKDLQQCQVIRRMAEDLSMSLVLRLLPTIRESDGLAMSSRNRYLSPQDRATAPLLRRALEKAQAQLGQESGSATRVLADRKNELADAGFAVDYFALVDLPDMRETERFQRDSALITAVRLGNTRLIDNIVFGE